jgi:hypothetical protein
MLIYAVYLLLLFIRILHTKLSSAVMKWLAIEIQLLSRIDEPFPFAVEG